VSTTVRYVWNLANLKYTIDSEDAAFGYPIQDLSEFVIETFLLRGNSRRQSEQEMFMMLSSMKAHVMSKQNSMLHTFARFLGAMDVKNPEDVPAPKAAARGAVVNPNGLIKASNCSLPSSLLTVYLFARSNTLQCVLSLLTLCGAGNACSFRTKESMQNALRQLNQTPKS
jgi:hypothetical protein